MKKSTKGAAAAGTAAVLLLGGAGSLAYWTGSADVNGGSFATGNVSITATDCSTAAWTYTTTNHTGSVVDGLVPGDSIAKDCTATVTGTGDHLYASLSTPSSVDTTLTGGSTPSTFKAPVTMTYTVAGADYTAGTNSDAFPVASGQSVDVTVHYTVDFDYGDDTTINAGDTQDLTVELGTISLTLKQEDPADQASAAMQE